MTQRIRDTIFALGAVVSLAACHSGSQAPGMDAKDLSDGRGARAGRFLPPPGNAAADANDSAPTGNATANESTP